MSQLLVENCVPNGWFATTYDTCTRITRGLQIIVSGHNYCIYIVSVHNMTYMIISACNASQSDFHNCGPVTSKYNVSN